jgi:ATP-binding cassette, subfamily B, multidrug efflux pump
MSNNETSLEQGKRALKPTREQTGKALRRLLRYAVHGYPVQFVLVVVFIILAAAAQVAGAVFVGLAVDDFITPLVTQAKNGLTPDYGPFGIACLAMAAIFVVGLVSNYLYSRMMAVLAQGVQKQIRDDLFNHMQDLPLSYFDSRTHGDIMSIYTNDVDTLREMLSRALPTVVSSLSTLVIVFTAMIIYNWFLTLVVLLFFSVILFLTIVVAKSAGKYFISQQLSLGKVDGYIEEMTNGQKVIKVFNYEKRAEKGFDEVNDELCRNATRANRFANILMPIVNQLGNIQYVVIGVLGAIAIDYGVGNVTLGMIMSFLILSKAFTQPIGQVSQQINVISLSLAGASRIFALIDEPKEVDDGYVELTNAKEGSDGCPIETPEHTGRWAWKHPHKDGSPTTYVWLRGKIDFHDVDFAYVPGKIVLHNITMYAKPGQKIAFVGPTGAGKTTITNLINRFYDIADGKIRFDDININKIKKADLRRSLGVVLQDTVLFTGTVKENIRFGKLDATDEEIVAAAKLANADNFIRMLPQGYDTVLKNAGASLSQGQRQLLAIARAAIADPPVMILDEATSSIDSRTEELVQEGMDAIMKGRTVFVIAHRLSTVKNSDVIMVIDQGRIIERGSHDDLLAKKGKYYELYTGSVEAAAH